MYVLGIALAIVMGYVFKKTLFRGEAPMFIMELPPYRMPTFRSLAIHTWEKGKHFLVKAGTYILAFSVIAWFLLNLPWGVEDKKDSYLGQVGQVVAPALEPLGFGNWAAGSSLIAGLVAKEIVVGTMAEIYVVKERDQEGPRPTFADDLQDAGVSLAAATRQAFGNLLANVGVTALSADETADQTAERNPLRAELRKQFTPLAAYAFIVFVLLYVPCVPAMVAMAQELGSWKWLVISFVYQTGLAWGTAALIYQGANSSGWEAEMGIADVIWLALILGGTTYLLYRAVWKKRGLCHGCDHGGCPGSVACAGGKRRGTALR